MTPGRVSEFSIPRAAWALCCGLAQGRRRCFRIWAAFTTAQRSHQRIRVERRRVLFRARRFLRHGAVVGKGDGPWRCSMAFVDQDICRRNQQFGRHYWVWRVPRRDIWVSAHAGYGSDRICHSHPGVLDMDDAARWLRGTQLCEASPSAEGNSGQRGSEPGSRARKSIEARGDDRSSRVTKPDIRRQL
jgi:hypothetical protein